MGTSSVFGGQGGASPLVPSFLGDAGAPSADDAADATDRDEDGDGTSPPSDPPQPPQRPPVPPNADPTRFTAARNNFSRFDRVLGFVARIYEQAFDILRIMGDAEANA